MHGRRQFVAWVVPFSGVTNATLVVCYICQARLPTTQCGNGNEKMTICFWGDCRSPEGDEEKEIFSPKISGLWKNIIVSFSPFVCCVVGGRWGWRQVSMSLIPWATHVIQWIVQQDAKSKDGANPYKAIPSSDWGLQLDLMKLELLVIAGQLYCGEYVLKSCTHRPSTQGSWEYPKSTFIVA